jgi:DNA-binding transcriptional regulator PaaX
MNGQQIAEEIERTRRDEDHFIRWWRKENDFVDYELIDRFLDNAQEEDEFAGYELVDLETMWETLTQKVPDRVRREKSKGGEMIYWQRPGKEDQSCPFSPESIMTIFDVETRGNVIE